MQDLNGTHQKSIYHRRAVRESTLCGCFYCLRLYPPSAIKEWVARDGDQTAICPHCSIDAVLPNSEIDLTPELLKAMHARWFTPPYISSTVTIEEATSVKANLEQRLGQPPWLRDVEVCKDWNGIFFVRVNMIQEPAHDVWNAFPHVIEGVRVISDDAEDAGPA